MNVSCNSDENICEATITITFPCKQTIMKHDMNKFNLTQFECRIQIVFIFYQLTSEKNQVHTGNLTHYRQTLQLINFYLIKNMSIRGN